MGPHDAHHRDGGGAYSPPAAVVALEMPQKIYLILYSSSGHVNRPTINKMLRWLQN
jgi:hypothetical protein